MLRRGTDGNGRRGRALRPSLEGMEPRELLSALPRHPAGARPVHVARRAHAPRPAHAGRALGHRVQAAAPTQSPPAALPSQDPQATPTVQTPAANTPPAFSIDEQPISGTFSGLYDARSTSLRLSGPGSTNGTSGASVDLRIDPDGGGILDLTTADSTTPVHLRLQGPANSASDPKPMTLSWTVDNGPGGGSGQGTVSVQFDPYRTGSDGTGHFTLQINGRMRRIG